MIKHGFYPILSECVQLQIYIREIKTLVYGKRQAEEVTSWPWFLLVCKPFTVCCFVLAVHIRIILHYSRIRIIYFDET